MTEPTAVATVDEVRLGAGFAERDHRLVVDELRKLDRRLQRYTPDQVRLSVSVKDRDTLKQKVTAELDIAKRRAEPIVAISTEPDLRDALGEIREDLWRQLDEMLDRAVDARRGAERPAPNAAGTLVGDDEGDVEGGETRSGSAPNDQAH